MFLNIGRYHVSYVGFGSYRYQTIFVSEYHFLGQPQNQINKQILKTSYPNQTHFATDL